MKKFFRVVFFLFLGLFIAIRFFDSLPDEDVSVAEEADGDFDEVDTVANERVNTHHRVWKDADDTVRHISFQVSYVDEESSYYYRDTVKIQYDQVTEKSFWNNFYHDLYNHDKDLLNPLQDSIRLLAKKRGMAKNDLMYSIVTLVQDIKYNYILSNDSCFAHDDFPCVPLQRFGILSPVEFLYSLSGDCDTRTVLLFTLLKNLGYDPIIVNSYQYGHSMLAVDLPSEGDYFIHKGRKFYFWETTSTGWMPGMLPPDMSNKDYWTIILDYEFEADPTRNY